MAAISNFLRRAGTGTATVIGAVADGIAHTISDPICWTADRVSRIATTTAPAISNTITGVANTVGTSINWTARTTGTIVKNTAAGLAVGIGYPVSVISGIVAVASGVVGAGSCMAYATLPMFNTVGGCLELALSPLATTAQVIDASVCPLFFSTFVTATGICLSSYAIARCARRAFN